MVNKRSLWFLTLFSLILVLSVYYITMPNELLLTNTNTKEVAKTEETTESAELVALRVEEEESLDKELSDLKTVLTDKDSTAEEKSEAYDKMKELNKNKGTEETLEKTIKTKFKLTAFVKINDSNIEVVVDSTKHDSELANNIMRKVQENFDKRMNITVKFQK